MAVQNGGSESSIRKSLAISRRARPGGWTGEPGSVESGQPDYAAFHLVTMGPKVSEETARLFAEDRYTDYLRLHGLGARAVVAGLVRAGAIGLLTTHDLSLTHIVDDLAPRAADLIGKRGYDAMVSAFHDNDLMLRIAGDTLALTPPLIISDDQIGEIMDKVGKVIRAVA